MHVPYRDSIAHLDDEDIQAFVDDKVSGPERELMRKHMATCSQCEAARRNHYDGGVSDPMGPFISHLIAARIKLDRLQEEARSGNIPDLRPKPRVVGVSTVLEALAKTRKPRQRDLAIVDIGLIMADLARAIGEVNNIPEA